MSMQAEKQRRDYAERRVIIGDRILSWDEFERYTKTVDDADAQRILDAAPLTPEAELQRAKQEQVAAVRADLAREAEIGARDMAGAYAARQALGGPMLGLGSIEAQELRGLAQSRAPGKMFSRTDILAIIRGQMAVAKARGAKDALGWVANIFENLE